MRLWLALDFLGALASSTLPAWGLHERSGGVYGRACDGPALARIYTTYAYHLLRKFAVLGFAFVARGRKHGVLVGGLAICVSPC
jgi:hypothetical protein